MILTLVLALAAAQGADPAADRCYESARAAAEENACAVEEFERADRALNAEYGAAMARIRASENHMSTEDGRPAGDALLRQTQRGWLTQRDEGCQLVAYNLRNGSQEGWLYERCRAEATRARTEWLRGLAPQ